MNEVDGNVLIKRDDATNAIVPVVCSYEENMENKQIDGNRLVVRDPDTNAFIPVVKIEGFVSDKDNKFKGYYASEQLLINSNPNPVAGDYAYVGISYPGTVYGCEIAGTWYNSGNIPPVSEEENWLQNW